MSRRKPVDLSIRGGVGVTETLELLDSSVTGQTHKHIIQYVYSNNYTINRSKHLCTSPQTCSGHKSKANASASQNLTITCLAKLILQAGQRFRHLQYLDICHASDHHSYIESVKQWTQSRKLNTVMPREEVEKSVNTEFSISRQASDIS